MWVAFVVAPNESGYFSTQIAAQTVGKAKTRGRTAVHEPLTIAARLQVVEDLSKRFVTHIGQGFGSSGFLVV